MMQELIVQGGEWKTPLTDVAGRTVGGARIRRTSYPKGYYRMEGMGGYEIYRVVGRRLPLTILERLHHGRWLEWMLDDPLHWIGMQERVNDLPPGRVLCAGLGLGLMLHHLADRRDVTGIVVVEINPDVIELIRPTLPDDPRVTIVCQDYYQYIERRSERFDSVLWDLAVGTHDETAGDLLRGKALTEIWLPGVPLFRFGMRKTTRPSWLEDAPL